MKRILFLLFFSLLLSTPLCAQSFKTLWKRVETSMSQDLPETAREQVKTIRAKALMEQNFAQLLRASLIEGLLCDEISPDSFSVWQKTMEEALKNETRPVERALWHAALGLTGSSRSCFMPTDTMSENRAAAHLTAALESAAALAATPYTDHLPLFVKGKDSRFFGNDLLHIVFRGAQEANVWDAKETMRRRSQVIQIYRRLHRTDAVVLLSLDSIAEAGRGESVAGKLEDDARFRALETLLEAYETTAVSAKIVAAMTALRSSYAENAPAAAHNDSLLLERARRILKKGKNLPGAAEVSNFLLIMQNPVVHLERFPQVLRPDSVVTFGLKGRNLCELELRWIPLFDSEVDYQNNRRPLSDVAAARRKGAAVHRVSLAATPSHRLISVETTLRIPQRPGIYSLEISGDGESLLREVVHVTRLHPFLFSFGKEGNRVCVLDSHTGQPLRDFRLTAYLADENGMLRQSRSLVSDGKPEVFIEPLSGRIQEQWFASVEGDAAAFALPSPNQRGYVSRQQETSTTSLSLLADRGIYRPGQQVFVSGVLFTRHGDDFKVERHVPIRLRLLDVNRKAVDSLSVSSDTLGTFSARFRLPAETLPGMFIIEARAASVRQSLGVHVEEYKRPIFTITTHPVTETYEPGDTVRISGEARTFTGVPLLDARVQFEVRRINWWRSSDEASVQRGEVFTDERGRFFIPVVTKATENDARVPYPERGSWLVTYSVTAESGETVQGSCSLPLNQNAERLSFSLPDVLCRSELRPLTVNRLNAAGTGRATTATYVIQPEGSENKILEAHFTTGEPFSTEKWKRLLPDRYWLVVRTDDGLLCDTATFCFFGENDVRPADRRRSLFFHEGSMNDKKTVWVGSPERDACLIFDLLVGDEILEHRLIALNDSLVRFSLPWKKEYGEGAKAVFALLRADTLHTRIVGIPRPEPDKALKLRWSSFRSRLTPGSQECWTLHVEDSRGAVPGVAVMARMTDASLEQLAHAPWSLNHLNFVRRLPFSSWNDQRWMYQGLRNSLGDKSCRFLPVADLQFAKWDERLFESGLFEKAGYNDYRYYILGARPSTAVKTLANVEARVKALSSLNRDAPEGSVMNDAVPAAAEATATSSKVKGEALADNFESTGASTNPQALAALRKDFAETAFFLPALRTNEQGETEIRFSLPESVTSWNVSALAFSSQMDYGKLDTTVVARKEFMVEPSLPRFVRKGDRCTVPVRVTNLTESSLQPVVTFLLTDAATGKTVTQHVRKLTVQPGLTSVVNFTVPSALTAEVIGCRVVGESQGFSDGEEHLLPVLSDEALVERSLSLTLDKEGVTKVRIDTLLSSPAARHRSLSLELTTHPAWAAVAALPSLTETDGCLSAVEWASRYYALALGLETLRRCPAIQEVVTAKSEEVEVWEKLRTEGFRELNPWLTQAERAAAQTRGLKNLFNEPLTDARKATALAKLQNYRNADGGFSWYPGMPSSPHITSEIALLLSRVVCLTEQRDGIHLLHQVLDHLQSVVKESQERVKAGTYLSDAVALRYLRACTLSGRKFERAEKKLLADLTERGAKLPMWEKSVLAGVLQSVGKKDEALLLGKSILEHTVVRSDLGRYFDTARASRSEKSYSLPTQCAAIDALQSLGFKKECEEMRRWLLQAKRAQMWETSTATADAIFTLLAAPVEVKDSVLRSTLSLPEPSDTPLLFTLSQGKKIWAFNAPSQTDTPNSMGHFKETFHGEVAQKASEWKIDKRTPGVSFASLTVSAVMPASQVQNQGNELSLSRRVEVKRDGQWQSLSHAEVRVGDRLRMVYVLKAARDLDFVSLKSSRPACLQPVRSLSGHVWEGGLDTYRAVQDASTLYFISSLPKGEHVFTEELFVDRSGVYSSGIATLSGVFAPEFSATAASFELTVKEAK